MKRTLTRPGARRRAALGAAALTGMVTLLGFGAGTAGATPAGHGGREHVALGDSYASGPLIPEQVDAACLRSSRNYPSLVAARTHARLTDVSCSGATTAEMTAPQGSAPAQLDALGRGTDLVTLSIGGNDIGFSSVIATCAGVTASDPTGAPCRAHFTADGHDQLAERVAQTAPKVGTVIRDIHRRSPHARVVVVGYPDLFPDDGSACTSPSTPFAAGDFGYLRDTEKTLNAMLATQARKAGARYVDTYTPTVGHDMCAPTGTRWIESLAPATPAAPAHPNALGEEAMAGAVLRTIARHHR